MTCRARMKHGRSFILYGYSSHMHEIAQSIEKETVRNSNRSYCGCRFIIYCKSTHLNTIYQSNIKLTR